MASHGVAGPATAGAAKTGRIVSPQLEYRHDGQVKGARVGFSLPKECSHPIVGSLPILISLMMFVSIRWDELDFG
ncbi:hypothetical protein WK16_17570 [Burkholderia ubonensis]|nr:hypothetical protein WK16_17570 [Burkholderia ubonensis]